MKKSIYFLSTVDPLDRSNGKGIVISGLLTYLEKVRGERPLRLLIVNSRKVEPGCFAMPGALHAFFNILIYALILRNKSIQECFYWKKSNIGVLKNIFENEDVDFFVFDTIRTAQYISYLSEELRKKCYVYLDDLFSLRYARMIVRIDQEKINPFGNFAKYIPSFLKGWALRYVWIIKLILRLEQSLVRKSEVKIPKLSRKSLLINPEEVSILRQLAKSDTVYECPPFLPDAERGEREFYGEKSLLFLGSLNFSHNKSGLSEFLREVFPKILQRDPDVCLHLVGGGVDSDMEALIASFPQRNLQVHGRVPSLMPYLSHSAMLIAPLVMGSGVKIKCIDALSYALPIVATTIGAEGIPIDEYNAGVVTDDWQDFAENCLRLLDPRLNAQFSLGAGKLFSDKYRSEAVEILYNHIFLGDDIPPELSSA